jgi:transcriptional regulator with XRE-family HTH domain
MTTTAADLARFLAERHWTRKRLGEELAVSQDRIRGWLNGTQPIPRHISLALAALVYGLPPWPLR